MQEYLQVRRGVAATDLPISLGERAALIDVPPEAFHSPHLRIMRELAIDITFMCNDVYSRPAPPRPEAATWAHPRSPRPPARRTC